MKLRKLTALLAAAVLAAGTLAGCGAKEAAQTPEAPAQAEQNGTAKPADQEQEKAPAEAAAGEDVTIWYYWETEGHQKALDKIIQDYNSSQEGYQVTAKYVPFADFKKQLSIGASASELPDVVILDSPDHASYVAMGIFSDITDRFDVSNYFQGAVDSCNVDGKLYGVPFGVNCLGLYYNEDLLEKAGCQVPTTWDELKETAGKLTSDSTTGLAFCSLQNEEGTFNFVPWLWSTGAGSYEMDSEGGVKALSFVKDLVDSGAMSKECINWTQGDVMNQFISGNVAMMINGPWQIPTMKQEAPDLNWNVALIPKDSEYASVLGGENYAVISGGNEEGALSFLEYATAEEQVKFMMDSMGYISADKNIAATQFTDEDAAMKTFTEELNYAKPRGPHADWPSISDAISLAFNQVITGEAEPAKAASDAQATIDSIINK